MFPGYPPVHTGIGHSLHTPESECDAGQDADSDQSPILRGQIQPCIGFRTPECAIGNAEHIGEITADDEAVRTSAAGGDESGYCPASCCIFAASNFLMSFTLVT